ncbi:GGDEF domain-containing protein [Actinoplanes sp. NPDC023801]|uniref:GGDEF domain-containing protein n=1 Tax=Actinoplanes sp. NPDC023801 TaxID=3154595 RepID=UPI00340EFB7C
MGVSEQRVRAGRPATVFAAMAALAIAVYQFLPDHLWLRTGWQVGIGWAGVAALLVGAHRLPRPERLPWWLFAAGVFSNSTGIAVGAISAAWYGLADLPTPADPFFLGLYPACAAALAVLIRRRDRRSDWAALVDAATITTGFGLLAWVYVIAPVGMGDPMNRLAHATQVAYPIGDLLLLAMTTRLLRSGGSRGAPFWWITGSLAAFLVGDSAWVVLGNLGATGEALIGDPRFYSGLQSVFMVAFVLFGIGCLHGGAREVAAPADARPAGLGKGLLVLLAGASLIAPAVLAAETAAGQVSDGWSIAACSAVLFLLVVARMALLIRHVERQARQVRELARSDELTGLPNRRAWNDELPRALERARRNGEPVAVAILDLDHFKQYNDTYGHPAGDQLLKAASAAWHSALRDVDVIARFGGEEFVVLLPAAGVRDGHQVLGRALAATPLGQTFSAGLAVWDGVETSDELLGRADTALYAAKAAGRNRIAVAGQPSRAAA